MTTLSLPFLRSGKRGMKNCQGASIPGIYSTDDNDDIVPQSLSLSAGFMLPPVSDPLDYCQQHLKIKYHEDNDQTLQFEKGTTTLAFIYQNGIVVAVDSRSTMGPFIASQKVKKINEINEYILATLAGGAADCQFWQRNLAVQCRLFELRNRHRISICAASKLIANTCNYYKRYGMSLGMMMMGYDKGVPVLYYVDDEGSRMKASDTQPRFSVGSGSTYAYGVLDSNWRWDLSDEEAIDLGKKAIYHATHRDAYSGGICNVYIFKPEGYRHVVSMDVDEMHDHSKDA